MPRVTVAKTIAPGPYPTAGVVVAYTATDTTDGNQFLMTGTELLLVRNTGGSSYTFTVTSVPNERGRSRNITAESIAAGAVRVLGPFKSKQGWATAGGTLEFTASNVAVEFAVIKLS